MYKCRKLARNLHHLEVICLHSILLWLLIITLSFYSCYLSTCVQKSCTKTFRKPFMISHPRPHPLTHFTCDWHWASEMDFLRSSLLFLLYPQSRLVEQFSSQFLTAFSHITGGMISFVKKYRGTQFSNSCVIAINLSLYVWCQYN